MTGGQRSARVHWRAEPALGMQCLDVKVNPVDRVLMSTGLSRFNPTRLDGELDCQRMPKSSKCTGTVTAGDAAKFCMTAVRNASELHCRHATILHWYAVSHKLPMGEHRYSTSCNYLQESLKVHSSLCFSELPACGKNRPGSQKEIGWPGAGSCKTCLTSVHAPETSRSKIE